MKKFLALILVIVMAFSLSVTAFAADDEAEAPKVALLMASLTTDFFVQIEAEAQAYAEEVGIDLSVYTCDNDTAKELANMENIISQEPDIILFTPADSDAATVSVERANDAGIPVITFDRAASGGEIVCHIASDNFAGGKMAGEYVVELFPDGAKVAELQGVLATDVAQARGDGFNSVIDATDNLELVAQQSANFNKDEGYTVFENMLMAHDDIQVVFAHNDEMALGAMEACKAAGRDDILIIGFDAAADAVAAVEEGSMVATVAQLPDKIIQTTIDTALAYLAGEEIEPTIGVELMLVTKEAE